MSFLAVSGFQAALLALVTAGAIVALYFLRLRHRRVFVASSLLWGRVLDEQLAHSLWEKLRRIISILLAVVIGLLIAMAVARPEMHWLTDRAEWESLRAVRNSRVHLTDGNQYFNRPGPRLVESLDILAGILHPL